MAVPSTSEKEWYANQTREASVGCLSLKEMNNVRVNVPELENKGKKNVCQGRGQISVD